MKMEACRVCLCEKDLTEMFTVNSPDINAVTFLASVQVLQFPEKYNFYF
jgi:hypothetical protein